MESYSAGGGEWHSYLTGSHDRGTVTSTGRHSQLVLVTRVTSTARFADQYWLLFAPSLGLASQCLAGGAIFLPASGASLVRYAPLSDLY